MKSKKQLFKDIFFITSGTFPDMVDVKFSEIVKKGLNNPGISDETFGKQSCIFIHWKNMNARIRGEELLVNMGHKVDRSYWPGKPVTEIQVTYFKGWHYDE